ncbi:MAG: SusC/RagA family TonB-linked outer membrane protein [Gemmatimonadetes bacterium]|nr:SusC/RagA family TonB-linked outer membrane protein [Gemmatimonadota bacterium]
MGRRVQYLVGALLAVLWLTPLSAQQSGGTIIGRVTDGTTQQPLGGVTITTVGNRGALSEADGRYLIVGVPAGTQTVQATMIGYAEFTQTVTVVAGQTTTLNIEMTAQAVGLSELVVVTYGQQRAADITGSVKQITPTEFNTGRIIRPLDLIQSKVAGLQIVDNNEPGGGGAIRIRGATSVNASSQPLVVVDGMPVANLTDGRGALTYLNSNDIASVTVLKDASATAMYGANAANGVIIITTKSGRHAPQLEYSGSVSASVITRLPDMLSAAEFRQAVQQYAPQSVGQLGSANTDWFSHVDRTGYGQEHNLALSGAGETMNYRLSMGYLDQKGVIDGTDMQRLSLGLNYDQRFFDDHLDIKINENASHVVNHYTPGGVISNAAQMGPTQPVFDASNPTGYYEWPGNTLQSADNPVAILGLATDKGKTDKSVGNLQAEYDMPFMSSLKAHVNLGYDLTQAERQTFSPSDLHSQLKSGGGGNVYWRTPSLLNTLLETYLNYTAPLSVIPGNIDLTGGYSYGKSHGEYPYFSGSGLSTNLLNVYGVPGTATAQNQQSIEESKLISVFGRLNYNYADKYLLGLSVRRDGSSRFGPTNAWGTFPAVSLAWRISEESFLKDKTPLSDLKLRWSWGKTGNQDFANYQQYSTYLVGNTQAQAQFGDEFVTTIRPGASDPNIKWEATKSWDFGIDYGFANQRFNGSIDWYNKSTSDLIFTVPVAAGTNLSNYLTTNIGSMKNQGFEFSLDADLLKSGSGGLNWNASFTASHNKNELVSINPYAGPAQQILVGGVAGGVGTLIQVLQPGVPINSFFVYEHKRDSNGNPIYQDTNGDGTINEQDLYVDQNGDGIINVADRRPFHDPEPKWMLGATSNMDYGAWDLSFTLRSYLGNYVYNNVASNLGTYSEVTRASPYNLQASVLKTGFETPQYLSDYYVEKASFLRMDNITLGYSFTYQGRPVRAFGTIQSAFTLTGYSGVDPTAGLNGLDNNIYPRSRTFTGGLSVRF